MATKCHMVIDAGLSSPKRAAISTNWDACVLCQEVTGEPLQCHKCFTNLYNRTRASECADAEAYSNCHFRGIAFAELVAFMEEIRREEGIAPVFKLTCTRLGWNSLV